MTLPITPDIDAVMTKLGALIASVVPSGVLVIHGPVNRAAQPKGAHVMMTHLFNLRLRTNETTYRFPDPPPAPNDGFADIEQGTEMRVQLDFYGGVGTPVSAPNQWAMAVCTIFRDEYACEALAPDAAPLYIDDARMMPLVTGEEQYLVRYGSTAHLQYNPVTTKTQEFAEELDVSLVEVNTLE